MSDLIYQESDATQREIPHEGGVSREFRVPPIERPVHHFPGHPWSGFAPFNVSTDQAVGPWPQTPIVLAPQAAQARAAREYVQQNADDLPEEMRESFLRLTGMFDLDVSGDDHGDERYDC